jgi:hypothetical protein
MGDVLGKNSLYTRLLKFTILTLFLAAIAAPNASATYIIFGQQTTTVSTGAQVHPQAMFTFDTAAHTISIELLNLEQNAGGVIQLISGIEFTLSNYSGLVGGSVPIATDFSLVTIGSGGVPTVSSGVAGWAFQSLTATTMTLCAICNPLVTVGTPDAGPSKLILGGPDPAAGLADTYTNANGSMTNSGHNPFILGSGDTYSAGSTLGPAAKSTPTWVLSVPNITAATTVTSVTFHFNTTYSTTADYEVDNFGYTPEPDSKILMFTGLGLVLLAGAARRYRGRRTLVPTLPGISTVS